MGSYPAQKLGEADVYIKAATLDDLLFRVLMSLLRARGRVVKSTRGVNFERTGVLLALTNPRARLSRSGRRSQLFSGLGELAWYLKASDSLSFIAYYVSAYKKETANGRTVPAAYGPRFYKFRGQNQINNVIALLKGNQGSRRAVIQLFDADDVPSGFVPCTCTLQFLVRQRRLHLLVHMRSNDAYLGLPHDVFTFTMLQELVARDLGIEVGEYKHLVGSLHLYERDLESAQSYVDDGLQPSVAMPPMPAGSQWLAVKKVLKAESSIRRKQSINLDRLDLDPYWADIVRLFRIYRYSKKGDRRGMERHLKKMNHEFYRQYIEYRIMRLDRVQRDAPSQQMLFDEDQSR